MGTQNTNQSVVAPCNGVLLGGAEITAIVAMEWLTLPNAKLITLQQEFNGGVNDCEVEIQGCLLGGEGNPEVLATINSGTNRHTHIFDKCFDRIRLNVTKFTAGGARSRMLLSARP